jgi:transposase-like protein
LRQFTAKTGTIFEDGPPGLDKWLPAMWQVVNRKNGVSSYEIARATGVTQTTAWFMDHRIHVALGMATLDKFSGHVEAYETFIGGKARKMHAAMEGKTSKTPTTVVANRKRKVLRGEVRKHVEAGFALYTDALRSYNGLDEFGHQVVDHAVRYVDGNVHANGLEENFWSLLKRWINGTYMSVEPFHLLRQLDEQAFQFNNRELTDGERFGVAVSGIV